MFYHIRNTPLTGLLLSLLIAVSNALNYNSTALVIGVDRTALEQAYYLLNSYGITYDLLAIAQSGTPLPLLETSTGGNYGLLVVVAQAQYAGISALTTSQWDTLYAYQLKYKVRMVHMNVVPTKEFGVELVAPCCANEVEQNATLVEEVAMKEFPTAGLRVTNLGTAGLYHYGAHVLQENTSTTTPFLHFQPNSLLIEKTVGGVINHFPDGREQMALFLESGNWSITSTYFNHAWVQWGYRGVVQGFRRAHLGAQVDDLFLGTAVYVTNEVFRLRYGDMYEHVQWSSDLNKRLNLLNDGSTFFLEFGFNANGNLIFDYNLSQNVTQFTCENPVFTDWDEPTQLEFAKPLGTGIDKWPSNPTFGWSADCVFLDPLAQFFANITNRDAFALVSHTFTHLELNSATYHDALREIEFNLMYAELMNFTNADKFSGSGLIPPAITGLHNGDAIRAWADNGLWNAIGDNTRPRLRNPDSYHWPLFTTMTNNGFDGYQITPRFATRIYYNCDKVPCDVQQWIDTENGIAGGTIHTLLDFERNSVTNQLISLFHDPYMFHQPNLRQLDVDPVLINGKMQKLSLIQMWVETITTEFTRIVTWPLITLKHDHIALVFQQRYVLDSCRPFIRFKTSTATGSNATKITGFTVFATTSNSCEVPIPVTIPGPVKDTKQSRTEKVGTDPATLWVKLDGAPISFELTTPITM